MSLSHMRLGPSLRHLLKQLLPESFALKNFAALHLPPATKSPWHKVWNHSIWSCWVSYHQFQDVSHIGAIAKSYQPNIIWFPTKSQKKMYEAQQENDQIRRFSNSPGSTEDRDCCKNFCESFIPVNSLVKLAMASCKLRHSKLFCCFQPRCEKQLFSLFKNQHHEKWVQLQVSSHFGCIYQLFSSPKGGFYHQSKVQNACHQNRW